MKAQIQIDPHALRAISRFSPNKYIRFSLNGIKVEATPTHTRLIATNGRALGIHESAVSVDVPNVVEGGYCEFIIPSDVISGLPKPAKHSAAVVLTLESAAEGTICAQGVTVQFTPVDAEYPEYWRRVPECPSNEVGQFNPALLGLFVAAAKDLGSAEGLLNMQHNGPHEPAVITMADTRFLGLLMPMRALEAKPYLWAKRQLGAPAEQAAAAAAAAAA